MSSDSENSDSESRKSDGSPTTKNKQNFPVQTSDLALSKSSFQQMLMKFNNRVVKNDRPIIKPRITPTKSILKNSKAPRDSLDVHAFNPPASSTQLFLNASPNVKLEDVPEVPSPTKKHKKKKKNSESFEESPSIVEKAKRKHDVSESFDSINSTETPKKAKKRKRHTSEHDLEEAPSFDSTNVTEIPKKAKKRKRHTSEHDLEEAPSFDSTNVTEIPKKAKKLKHHKSESEHEVQLLNDTNTEALSKLETILEKFKTDHSLTESDDVPGFSKDITSSRYETFLVQTPKSFDPKKLIGLELSLNNKVRIKYDGIKYDCIPTPCEEPATFFNQNGLNIVCPSATIVIKQHIKHKDLPEATGTLMNGVAFPNDLKERHPLFGADYLKIISLEQNIRDKLKAAIASNEIRIKKEKQVKHEPSSKESKPQDEEIFKLLNVGGSEVVGKKHKKGKRQKDFSGDEPDPAKNDDIINQILVSKSLEISRSSGKKKKHKKRDTS